MLISQGSLAPGYGFAKLGNEITKMQNHVIYKKKQITWFSLKTKCCRVRMSLQTNLAAKTTWSESLICRTIILWHISSLESKIQLAMLLPKAHEANPTELFQAVVKQNVWKWQPSGRRAEKYGPATIRGAHATSEVLGRLRVITTAFRGRYEARITGYHLQNSKKGFKTTKVIIIITMILKLHKLT